MRLRLKFLPLLLTVLILTFVSCSGKTVTQGAFLFDTYCTVTVYQAPEDIDDIFSELWERMGEIEKNISRTRESSTVSALNRGESAELDEDTAALLEISEYFYNISEGVFSPYLGEVISLWAIGTEHMRVPSQEEIDEALKVKKLDFGAIGKGYASDVAASFLKARGVQSALINFGGNVCCVGYKKTGPLPFMKEDFRIGIRDPHPGSQDYIKTVEVHDLCVVTSGIYERYFEIDGKVYGHIFDAETGYPAQSNVLSATVTGKSGTICDALSTICYLLGPEKSRALLENFPDYYVEFII